MWRSRTPFLLVIRQPLNHTQAVPLHTLHSPLPRTCIWILNETYRPPLLLPHIFNPSLILLFVLSKVPLTLITCIQYYLLPITYYLSPGRHEYRSFPLEELSGRARKQKQGISLKVPCTPIAKHYVPIFSRAFCCFFEHFFFSCCLCLGTLNG